MRNSKARPISIERKHRVRRFICSLDLELTLTGWPRQLAPTGGRSGVDWGRGVRCTPERPIGTNKGVGESPAVLTGDELLATAILGRLLQRSAKGKLSVAQSGALPWVRITEAPARGGCPAESEPSR